jgi:hypothetical protein
MCLKSNIRQLLREHYGDFVTNLEHQYETKLTENLILGSINKKKEWITYNQVVLEVKNSLKDNLRVKELQYKLTENINPNDVCIEILEDIKDVNSELQRLYYKIKNFDVDGE